MESIDIWSVNLSKLDTEHTEIFFIKEIEILKLRFVWPSGPFLVCVQLFYFSFRNYKIITIYMYIHTYTYTYMYIYTRAVFLCTPLVYYCMTLLPYFFFHQATAFSC